MQTVEVAAGTQTMAHQLLYSIIIECHNTTVGYDAHVMNSSMSQLGCILMLHNI